MHILLSVRNGASRVSVSGEQSTPLPIFEGDIVYHTESFSKVLKNSTTRSRDRVNCVALAEMIQCVLKYIITDS